MVGKNTNLKKPLLPNRYPIEDFFICDVTDVIPKDDMSSMEHPIFSLSTKPDTRIREYSHNNVSITVAPSPIGLATIHDKDILIYCISQLIAKMNVGEPPQRTLHLKAHDLLIATNRKTDGRGYEQLVVAFERLSGTRIKTNIKTNHEEIMEGFGLIDSWRIIRHTASGRMLEIKINLSDWVFNTILGREVLTLHRNYFRLRKPLERRMYEIARKHCGQQDTWCISLATLQKKCGSSSTLKEFRRLVTNICNEDSAYNHMPDYAVTIIDDSVEFKNRNSQKKLSDKKINAPTLDSEIYHKARIVAPGYDVYYLKQEWLNWWTDSGKPQMRNPNQAFISFCKRRYEKEPNP